MKEKTRLIEDLRDGIEIDGTVEEFGFTGFYETDTPDRPIEVLIHAEGNEIWAHCESNGILYSDELGGDILEFIENHTEYTAEEVMEARQVFNA